MSLSLQDLIPSLESNKSKDYDAVSSLFTTENKTYVYHGDKNYDGVQFDPNWTLAEIEKKRNMILQRATFMSPHICNKLVLLYNDLDALELIRDTLPFTRYYELKDEKLLRIHDFMTLVDENRKKEEVLLKTSMNLSWSYWRVWIVVKVSYMILDWWWKHDLRPRMLKKGTKTNTSSRSSKRKSKEDTTSATKEKHKKSKTSSNNISMESKSKRSDYHSENKTSSSTTEKETPMSKESKHIESSKLKKNSKHSEEKKSKTMSTSKSFKSSKHENGDSIPDTTNSPSQSRIFDVDQVYAWREPFFECWRDILRNLSPNLDIKPHFSLIVVWLFLTCKAGVGITLHDIYQRFGYVSQQIYISIFDDEYCKNIKLEQKGIEDLVSFFEIEGSTKDERMYQLKRSWLESLCSNITFETIFDDACRIKHSLSLLNQYNATAVAKCLLEMSREQATIKDPTIDVQELQKLERKVLSKFEGKYNSMHATHLLSEEEWKARIHAPEIEVLGRLFLADKKRMKKYTSIFMKSGLNFYPIVAERIGFANVVDLQNVIMSFFGELKGFKHISRSQIPKQPLHLLTLPYFENFPIFKQWESDESSENLLESFACKSCAFTSKTFEYYVRHKYTLHNESPYAYHSPSVATIGSQIDTLSDELGSELDVFPQGTTLVSNPRTEEMLQDTFSNPECKLSKLFLQAKKEKISKLQIAATLGIPIFLQGKFTKRLNSVNQSSSSQQNVSEKKKTSEEVHSAGSRDRTFLTVLFCLKQRETFENVAKLLHMSVSQVKSRYYRAQRMGLNNDPTVHSKASLSKEDLLAWYSDVTGIRIGEDKSSPHGKKDISISNLSKENSSKRGLQIVENNSTEKLNKTSNKVKKVDPEMSSQGNTSNKLIMSNMHGASVKMGDTSITTTEANGLKISKPINGIEGNIVPNKKLTESEEAVTMNSKKRKKEDGDSMNVAQSKPSKLRKISTTVNQTVKKKKASPVSSASERKLKTEVRQVAKQTTTKLSTAQKAKQRKRERNDEKKDDTSTPPSKRRKIDSEKVTQNTLESKMAENGSNIPPKLSKTKPSRNLLINDSKTKLHKKNLQQDPRNSKPLSAEKQSSSKTKNLSKQGKSIPSSKKVRNGSNSVKETGKVTNVQVDDDDEIILRPRRK